MTRVRYETTLKCSFGWLRKRHHTFEMFKSLGMGLELESLILPLIGSSERIVLMSTIQVNVLK